MSFSGVSIDQAIAGEAILRSGRLGLLEEAAVISPGDEFRLRGDSTDSIRIAGLFGEVVLVSCTGCTAVPVPQVSAFVSTGDASLWLHQGRSNVVGVLGSATPLFVRKTSTFERCFELLLARRSVLTGDQIAAFERQLRTLALSRDEFEARGIDPSPTSFDGMVAFLAHHQPDHHPNISLSADGRFAASWMAGKRSKVTLTFEREGGDWTGLSLEGKPLRQTGAFVTDSLVGIAQPYRTWIKA